MTELEITVDHQEGVLTKDLRAGQMFVYQALREGEYPPIYLLGPGGCHGPLLQLNTGTSCFEEVQYLGDTKIPERVFPILITHITIKPLR